MQASDENREKASKQFSDNSMPSSKQHNSSYQY